MNIAKVKSLISKFNPCNTNLCFSSQANLENNFFLSKLNLYFSKIFYISKTTNYDF